MPRFRRSLLPFLAILSLLVALSFGVFWYLSFNRAFDLTVNYDTWPMRNHWHTRYCGIRLVKGYWLIQWGTSDFFLDHPESIMEGWGSDDAADFARQHPAGFTKRFNTFDLPPTLPSRSDPYGGHGVGPVDYLLGIPHSHGFGSRQMVNNSIGRTDIGNMALAPAWVVSVILIPPLIWLARLMRDRKRLLNNHCTNCGYDLRATPDRCPECGTVPPKMEEVST